MWCSVLYMETFDSDILNFSQSTHDDLGNIFYIIIAMKKINLAIELFNGEAFGLKFGNFTIKLGFPFTQIIH